MKNYGVFLGAFVTANTGTHTLTSAATIHSTLLGQVPLRSPGACLVQDGFDEFVNTAWCRRVPSCAAWAVESALSTLMRPRPSSRAHPTHVPDAE